MGKIKKSFKIDFEASKSSKEIAEQKKIKNKRNIFIFKDILLIFFKIVGYIFICILISLGATAILNANIRELILSFIR